jgi:hypothetical protein
MKKLTFVLILISKYGCCIGGIDIFYCLYLVCLKTTKTTKILTNLIRLLLQVVRIVVESKEKFKISTKNGLLWFQMSAMSLKMNAFVYAYFVANNYNNK